MHNGNIACWNLVKRDLAVGLREQWFLGVLGGTDSEWAFAVFLDEMERGGVNPSADPGEGGFGHAVLRKAMLKTIARINALVKAIPKERLERGEDLETRSLLNFAVTDGHSVVCTRYVSSRTDDAASLYWSSGTSWREVDANGGPSKESDTASIKSKKSSAGWSEIEEREEKRFVMERRDRGADIVLVASEPLTFERGALCFFLLSPRQWLCFWSASTLPISRPLTSRFRLLPLLSITNPPLPFPPPTSPVNRPL